MECKDFLKKTLKSNHEIVKKLIDDIGDEESMRRDYQFCNHIRWQTGHLIQSARLGLKLLGVEEKIPEEWTKFFGNESTLSENASSYPTMSELKDKLYLIYDLTLKALDNIPPEKLYENVVLRKDWEITPIEGITLFCRHEFYHCGQITVMRRVLGRDRPFG